MRSIAIIGAGPAGLMAAEVLSQSGVQVDVYDSMPSVGRKFLLAGQSGLNLTHSEPFEQFAARYGSRRKWIEPMLKEFGANELRNWAQNLGIETFVGTSGRVFPKGMKASPLLRVWLKRLQNNRVMIHTRHRWVGWNEDRSLRFETEQGEKAIKAGAVILALGGGSWLRLGSDGAWVHWLEQAGVKVEALKSSNCGFDVAWSEFFKEKYQGHPIKSVVLSFGAFRQQGEFVVTKHGVEGSLIYACSALVRDAIEVHGTTNIQLDLAPNLSREDVLKKLSKPRGSKTMASHLEKTVGIKDVKAGLLREFLSKEVFASGASVEQLADGIKSLSVPLVSPRPIDEAISSAGGIPFEELDEHLMLKKIPGVFCAGEMLDWEAPTGGYLLTACFASGRVAGRGALKSLA
jgi:uncharacterized flavoprotein (TIGR03862 family)